MKEGKLAVVSLAGNHVASLTLHHCTVDCQHMECTAHEILPNFNWLIILWVVEFSPRMKFLSQPPVTAVFACLCFTDELFH